MASGVGRRENIRIIANNTFILRLWPVSRTARRMLTPSEKKQKNCQKGIDDYGWANLRKGFHSAQEQISKNDRIPGGNNQDRKRQFAGCLLLSGCQECDQGKSQSVLPVEQGELGISQFALCDFLEHMGRENE